MAFQHVAFLLLSIFVVERLGEGWSLISRLCLSEVVGEGWSRASILILDRVVFALDVAGGLWLCFCMGTALNTPSSASSSRRPDPQQPDDMGSDYQQWSRPSVTTTTTTTSTALSPPPSVAPPPPRPRSLALLRRTTTIRTAEQEQGCRPVLEAMHLASQAWRAPPPPPRTIACPLPLPPLWSAGFWATTTTTMTAAPPSRLSRRSLRLSPRPRCLARPWPGHISLPHLSLRLLVSSRPRHPPSRRLGSLSLVRLRLRLHPRSLLTTATRWRLTGRSLLPLLLSGLVVRLRLPRPLRQPLISAERLRLVGCLFSVPEGMERLGLGAQRRTSSRTHWSG